MVLAGRISDLLRPEFAPAADVKLVEGNLLCPEKRETLLLYFPQMECSKLLHTSLALH